jgi:hypothetical protein
MGHGQRVYDQDMLDSISAQDKKRKDDLNSASKLNICFGVWGIRDNLVQSSFLN